MSTSTSSRRPNRARTATPKVVEVDPVLAGVVTLPEPPKVSLVKVTAAPAEATAPAAPKAAKVATSKAAPKPCRCGCEALAAGKSLYRPGHDARHAGQVARTAARYILVGEVVPETVWADLGSDKLVAKAKAHAERLAANLG